MKGKLIKALISCIVVAGIGFGGYYGYKTYFAKKPVVASVSYVTMTAKKMNLEVTIQGTGSAYAASTKDVMPNNNGTLKDLGVKVGDTVTAGQKLFVSDSDDLRKAVTTAQNNLAKQKLQLSTDQSATKVDDNKIAMDNISINDANTQLNDAYKQLNKMTVTAPIGGIVTAVNNSNGDNLQSAKSVLTIIDMSSMKVKVSVDELNIGKVAIGQKASVKFDALKGKSYEGNVEAIASTGTTSNNVTSYDVVVAVKDPAGIKLGMNANVTIMVESKENVIAIPAEALIDNKGQRFVRLITADTAGANNNQQNSGTQNSSQANGPNSDFKLVAIKTGLETDNYIEVTEGLNEGDKLQVQLPSTSSSTNNNNKNNLNGLGGDMRGLGGAPQGGNGGGPSGATGGGPRN